MIVAATTLARSGEAAKAGPIGLAVILLLGIACYFLFKSMSRHMREVRENFPSDQPASGQARPDVPASTALPRAETVRTTPGDTAEPAALPEAPEPAAPSDGDRRD